MEKLNDDNTAVRTWQPFIRQVNKFEIFNYKYIQH